MCMIDTGIKKKDVFYRNMAAKTFTLYILLSD